MAVRQFHAGATAKGLVACGASVGLLISPFVVSLVAHRGWSTGLSASRLLLVGAAAFVVSGLFPVLPVYVVTSLVGLATAASIIPLLTQMYQDNYPENRRGYLFSRTVMIRIATAAGFGELAGYALNANMGNFRAVILVIAAAFAFASFCLGRCPTRALARDEGTHPFRAFRYIRTDPLFRLTLIVWMFMGFGNLMMLPLRVEYLANPKYGKELSVATIALMTAVIPNIARLIMSPIWGWLFDRMNFFALRMTLNAGFAIGILAFFTSREFGGLLLGAIIFGVSNAGGDVAWSLWVTKFAPPERVADYMSVHTFFTGIRGVAAPLVAFYFAERLSLGAMAGVSAGLIVISILLMLPEVKFGRGGMRSAAALVEEVSD